MNHPTEKPLIVMVDDDPDFQSIVQGWLTPRYDMLSLADGESLLEEIEDIHPDLLILDVLMPGPDGFKLCRRLRSQTRFMDMPILFLTSCRSDVDFARNLDSGGSAYLMKPVERRELLTTIQELLPS